MSNEALTWAWNQVRERNVPRNLIPELIAMADQANDQGVAWLLNSTLAAKTATTERTVQRNIASLASLGMIQIIERRQIGRNNRSNLYLLNLPDIDDKQRAHFVSEMTEGVQAKVREFPESSRGEQAGADRVTPVTPRGRHQRHPEGDTSVTQNPQYEPTLKGSSPAAREESQPKPGKGRTLLPESWSVPEHIRDKLKAQGYDEQHIDEQADLFKVYWLERRDDKAKKASWSATFMNWMKRAGKGWAPEGAREGSRKPTGENYVRPHTQRQAKRGAALLGDLADGLYEDERGEETGPGDGHQGQLIDQ